MKCDFCCINAQTQHVNGYANYVGIANSKHNPLPSNIYSPFVSCIIVYALDPQQFNND